jgi:Tfp pilus assembly protein PilF
VTRYPQSIQLLIGLGSGQFLAGHASASIQTLVKAVQIDPANPGPYPFLADASGISPDNAEQVQAAFAEYLRVAPNDARASYDYGLNLLRRAAQAGENSDVRAEALLQHAVALDPASADAHFQLGVIYGRRGAHDQAVSELESAVRLSPNFKDAHYRLALAYQQAGRTDLSAKEMQRFRAAQEAPQSANIDQLISVFNPGESTASRGVVCPGDSP